MFRCIFLRLCVLVIPLSIFLSACVFNSEEEYFKNLTKPDPTAVGGSINVVDLGDFNPGDTIDLFGTTTFDFSLSGKHGEVESATISLDGKVVSNSTANSFRIYKSQLSAGTFALTLDLTTSSGSGSLAEAVGSEKLKITLKWIVRVDLSPPPQPVPTLDIVDGFLTVQWPAYSKPNFQSYIVKRKLRSGVTQSFEIKNKQTVSWRDESYAGGHTSPIDYSVSIVSETGTVTSVPISRVDPIDFSFSFNSSDSTVTFKWKPTKFYGTFKGYKFSLGNGDPTVLTDINDSTFTGKLSAIRFGGDASVWFTVQSRSEDLPQYWNLSVCKLGTPLTFAPAGEIRFNSYLNSFIAVDTDKKLLELNEQLEPVRTIATLKGTSWRMPYPGNYIYTTATAYNDKNIYRLNLEDDSEVPYDNSYNRSHTVASNGLICTEYFRRPIQIRPNEYTLPVWSTKVIDAAGGSNVYYEYSNTTDLSAVISEDGRFIWANDNRVFRISGGSSQLVGSFSGAGSFIGFRPDNSDEMMFRDGDKINFYDANTFTLIRSINPPANYYYWNGSYDVQTKNMLWKSLGASTRIYTVNIETGATRSIQISTEASPADLYMIDGVLIYNGNYIQVK